MTSHKLPGEFMYDGMAFGTTITSPSLIEGAKDLKLTPEDTTVATYTKSGTTWMKYLAYLVAHDGKGEDMAIHMAVRYFELKIPGFSEEDLMKALTDMPAPRFFCTHLPFRVLKRQVVEDKAKFIVVMRNPKDTLVSFYHFYRMNKLFGFSGTWDEFFQLFTEKKLVGGDIFDYNLEWWQVRELDNVLIVKYEEMKEDLDGVVRKVAKFMGRDLSEEVIAKIVHLTSFQQMKDNPGVNGSEGEQMGVFNFKESKFMRKGVVGDWTNYFSAEQTKYTDELYEERCRPVGLTFKDMGDQK